MSVSLFELFPFMFGAFEAICITFWYFVIFPRTSKYLVVRHKMVNGKIVDVYTEYITYKQLKKEGKERNSPVNKKQNVC